VGQQPPNPAPVTGGVQQLVAAIKAKQEQIRLTQEALAQQNEELKALME
jgi:hypothetical protein